jgi:hypothetical protein
MFGFPRGYRSLAPHGRDWRDHKDAIDPWKLLLGAGLCFAFIVSAAFALVETRYLLWGRTVPARLVEVKETKEHAGAGQTTPILVFQYTFNDGEQGLRIERDTVPIDWPRPAGNTVDVQYIPAEPGSSRLLGHRNEFSVIFCLGCLAAVVAFVVKLALEANEPISKPRMGLQPR